MGSSWPFDGRVYFGPDQVWCDVPGAIELFDYSGPEVNQKIVVVDLKREDLLCFVFF